MGQEKSSSQPGQPEAPKEHPDLARAEEVRTAIGIDDTPGNWRKLLSLVYENPKSPEASPTNDVVQAELMQLYRPLLLQWERAAKAINAVLGLVNAKQPVPEVLRGTVKRELAKYVEMRDFYDHRWRGSVPSGSPLPPYLAEYVQPRPDERFALKAARALLPLQYDVRDTAGIEAIPMDIAPAAEEIARGAIRLDVRMQYVLDCADASGTLRKDKTPYERFLKAGGYTEWRKQELESAKLLVGYILKHRESIERYAKVTGKDIGELTMAEGMECCVNYAGLGSFAEEFLARVPELLSKGTPDMREFIRKMFEENPDLYPERMLQVALAPLANLDANTTQEEREEYQRNSEAIGRFFLGADAHNSIRRVDRHIQHMNARQQAMVKELCRRVQDEQTIRSLLSAAFIVPEGKGQGDLDRQVSEKLGAIIRQGDLSLRDAFDVYYLTSSGGGSLPLAYKAVHILRNRNEGQLATELETHIFRALYDIGTSELSDAELKFDAVQLSETQKRELRNVREYLKDSGIDALSKWAHRFWTWAKTWPEFSIPLGILGASGIITPAAMLASKLWVRFRLTKLEEFTNMGPEQVKSTFNLDVPVEQIRLAQEEAMKVKTEYYQLAHRFHMPFITPRRLRVQGMEIAYAARSTELQHLAKALKARYPKVEDVSRLLAKVTTDEGTLRSALTGAGYSVEEAATGIETAKQTTEWKLKASQDLLQKLTELREQGGLQAGKTGGEAEASGAKTETSPGTDVGGTTGEGGPKKGKGGGRRGG